jgi:4-amino-4-deoxy-L-arabinose transferase-like glycosyltransferase
VWPLLVLLALTLVPGGVLAQSLGQAAAQERERREKLSREGKKATGRAFTNEDLKGGDGGTKEGAAPTLSQDPPARGEGGTEGAQAALWQKRADRARAALNQWKGRQASIESRLAGLRQELNPMSPSYRLDPNRFLRIQEQIRQAESELADVQKQVQTAQEAWSQLEDEARRAGVPQRVIGEPLH